MRLKKKRKKVDGCGRWGIWAIVREVAEERIVSEIRVGRVKKEVQVARRYASTDEKIRKCRLPLQVVNQKE